jgi:hypothetical protein
MNRPANHAIMAERYRNWAREQVDRAKLTLNPKLETIVWRWPNTIRSWQNSNWPLPND